MHVIHLYTVHVFMIKREKIKKENRLQDLGINYRFNFIMRIQFLLR